MTIRIVLAGCGNMGFAMVSGWLSAGKVGPAELVVVEPNADLRKRVADLGISAFADASELAPSVSPELVIFAVKPQVMGNVVPAYRHYSDSTFVSIAAGTGVAAMQEILGKGAAIIRCMPNTPAAIGHGMMVLFSNANVGNQADDFVADLMSASGEVARIDDENLMDAVTAVSGSGPAYIFHFIEAFSAAGRKAGLPDDVADKLAMQTVYGAAKLAVQSADDPATLRKQVTSPNGTTAAALEVLMAPDGLEKLLIQAVDAARIRGVELGRQE